MFDGIAGSLNSADLYGSEASSQITFDPLSSYGPNQGSVAPSSVFASGDGNMVGGGGGAAFSWIGFIGLLVATRILIDVADR